MTEQGRNDIATFPELFAGLDQFIAEQASTLKRTGTLLAVTLAASGVMLYAAKAIA